MAEQGGGLAGFLRGMGQRARNHDWTGTLLGAINPMLGMAYSGYQAYQNRGQPLPDWMGMNAPMPQFTPGNPWEAGGNPRYSWEQGYGTDAMTNDTYGVLMSDQNPQQRQGGGAFRTVISGQALDEMARNQMAPDLMTQQTGASRHLNNWAQKTAK